MSFRAVGLGLLLGILVSVLTYLNDRVVLQTFFIGNFLPISIFGSIALIAVLANPILRVFGKGGPLKGSEIAVAAAVSLAACGWPGSNLYRQFNQMIAMPGYLVQSNTAWQANGLMSYLPNASSDIAPGHVSDPVELVERMTAEPASTAVGRSAGDGSAVDGSAELMVWLQGQFDENDQLQFKRMVDRDDRSVSVTRILLRTVNQKVIQPVTVGSEGNASSLAAVADRFGLIPEDAAKWWVYREQSLAKADALQQEIDQSEAEVAGSVGGGEADGELDQAVELLRREANYYMGQAARGERRVNRGVLVAMMDGVVLPAPDGPEMILGGGVSDPFVTDTFLQGTSGDMTLGLSELPWYAWLPSLTYWMPMVLLTGLMALFLAAVVHPQWSRRELLTYPIARFIQEMTDKEPGDALPLVAKTRLFWLAFGLLLALHLLNGFASWNAALKFIDFSAPAIPMQLEFSPLRELFPMIARMNRSDAYFLPTIFPTVIEFAFFLTTRISFSLGISHLLLLLFTGYLAEWGIVSQQGYMDAGNITGMRFGSYLAFAFAILYTGRRYYIQVTGHAFGLPRQDEIPSYAVWAVRGLLLCFLINVYLMTQTGLHWSLAVAMMLLVLLMFLVLGRVVAETGMFFFQANWLPVSVVTAMLGFEFIGPTTFMIMGFISLMLVADPREALMGYLVNSMKIADRAAEQKDAARRSTEAADHKDGDLLESETADRSVVQRKVGWMVPVFGAMIVISLIVAGMVTFRTQYNLGAQTSGDGWANFAVPGMTQGTMNVMVSDASASGTLHSSLVAEGNERWSMLEVDTEIGWFFVLGVVFVLVAAWARLRFSWWPFHPVIFLVWGTYPISNFAFSFLIGWMIKASVTKVGGARGYQNLKPMMIGVIAGELTAGLLWIFAGWIYYYLYQLRPPWYVIFPL